MLPDIRRQHARTHARRPKTAESGGRPPLAPKRVRISNETMDGLNKNMLPFIAVGAVGLFLWTLGDEPKFQRSPESVPKAPESAPEAPAPEPSAAPPEHESSPAANLSKPRETPPSEKADSTSSKS